MTTELTIALERYDRHVPLFMGADARVLIRHPRGGGIVQVTLHVEQLVMVDVIALLAVMGKHIALHQDVGDPFGDLFRGLGRAFPIVGCEQFVLGLCICAREQQDQ